MILTYFDKHCFSKVKLRTIVVNFLVVSFVALVIHTESLAQTKIFENSNDNFGAETIDEIKPETLPVELVEEKDHEAESASGRAADSHAANEQPVSSEAQKLTTILDVRDADIPTLVKAISKATKRNFIIDNRIKGKVTVHLPTPVNETEALKIFDSVLLMNGFTSVPAGKNLWKIMPSKDARQTTIPLIAGEEKDRSDILVTELIPMRYVKSEDMQQLLTQFISPDGGINAFAGTNSLLMIDSAKNIERVKKIIEQLDVPARDQDITIIPIQYADAKDISDKVTEILGEAATKEGAAKGSPVNTPQVLPKTLSGAKGGRTAAGTTVDSRTLPIKIIPDERTNSLIVVADPEMTAKVRALCDKLDSELDRSDSKFYVYRLKHSDADELADVLNGLISGNPVSSKKSESTGSSLTRSTRSGMFGYGEDGGLGGSYGSSRTRSRSSRTRSSRYGGGDSLSQNVRDTAQRTGLTSGKDGKANFEGDITIASDAATNSLLINASKSDYQRVKEVIDILDVKRRQVLVEATILEVGLTSEQGLGVEFLGSAGNDNGGVIAQTNYGGITDLVSKPQALTDLTLAAASSGTLTLPGGLVVPTQAVLVTALSKNQNVNVLSTPTILSTDNQEAEIVVGENVPFVIGRSNDSTNLSSTYNEIDRQDVGITLRITPQISSNDYVTLQIFIEISNVVASTRNDPNGPTTTIRTTETTVEVKNNQMIVTGGLLADSLTDSTRGVPFLEDIPVFGHLFQRADNSSRRTNLLVFLTPRIVFDQYEARDQTKEFSGKVEDVIKKNEVQPNRLEVLHSDHMDQVIETNNEEQALPSTITAPVTPPPGSPEAAALERTNQRLKSLLKAQEKDIKPTADVHEQSLTLPETTLPPSQPVDTSKQSIQTSSPTDEDTLRFTVSPNLPVANITKSDTAAVSSDSSSRTSLTNVSSKNVFVVMRSLSSSKSDVPSKFKTVDSKKTIGMMFLQEEVPLEFKTGSRYSFYDGSATQRFVVLGVFKTQQEASKFSQQFSDNKGWNVMTGETMANWTEE